MSSANAEATPMGSPSGVDRRERLHHTISSLIRLRQDVVVSYCRLAGVSSFERREVEAHHVDADELRSFCQIMVDYTAMGHFEVYQRIIEGKERRQAVKEAAAHVYPAIAETTDYLVDFNAQQALNALYMAQLGEILNDKEISFRYNRHYFSLKTRINNLMWNDEDGIYYDLDRKEQQLFGL